MGSSFDLPELERFTTGTEGPPGQRVFYLQAVGAGEVVSLRLEKAQVAALADYLAQMLSDLPTPSPDEVPDRLELVEPVLPAWTVGQMGVVFDDGRDRVLVRADEVQELDEAGEPVPDDEAGVARFALSRAQVAGFVVHAASVVASGRPACELCGRPKDAEGHMCIKTNGHKKLS